MGFFETIRGIFNPKYYENMFSSFLNQLGEYAGREIPKKILDTFIATIDRYIKLFSDDGFEDIASDLESFKAVLLRNGRFSKYQLKQLRGILVELESK